MEGTDEISTVGEEDGVGVGSSVGSGDGSNCGAMVGKEVGHAEGAPVGILVGFIVGYWVGRADGGNEGTAMHPEDPVEDSWPAGQAVQEVSADFVAPPVE